MPTPTPTDWQGDADERLTGEPGSEVAEVFGAADERGVDVRGLVWRSHLVREFGPWAERLVGIPLDLVHDPDGRPGPLRGGSDY